MLLFFKPDGLTLERYQYSKDLGKNKHEASILYFDSVIFSYG